MIKTVQLLATTAMLLWLSACAGGGQQDKGPNPQIAFTRSDEYGLHDIYVVNPDGTGETLVTKDFRVQYPLPVWSPDGEKMAFIGEDGLYVVTADGDDPTRLSDATGGQITSLSYVPRDSWQ